MKLFLLRHGIAIDRDDPDCPAEPERYLTDLGRDKTARACQGLASSGCTPDAIIASPFVRARETAEIAATALPFAGQLESDEALMWMKPPGLILERLAARNEGTVMLVGHAPHLDLLVAHLCGAVRAITSMKKAGVVELECFELNQGGAVLIAAYPPRVLRAMAG